MSNKIGGKGPTGEQYYNMMLIYKYLDFRPATRLHSVRGHAVGPEKVQHLRAHVRCPQFGSDKLCQHGKVQLRFVQENNEHDHANLPEWESVQCNRGDEENQVFHD